MFIIFFKCHSLGKSALEARFKVKLNLNHPIGRRTYLWSLINFSKTRRSRWHTTRKSRRSQSKNMISTLIWRSSVGSAWKRSVDLTEYQGMWRISIANFMIQKQAEPHLLRRMVKQYLMTQSVNSRTKRKWKTNRNLSRRWNQIYRNWSANSSQKTNLCHKTTWFSLEALLICLRNREKQNWPSISRPRRQEPTVAKPGNLLNQLYNLFKM